VVLYEMVTGRFLFRGGDVSETLAAVLKQEPDLSPVPRKLHKLLRSCLEKQPDRRLRDIADAWLLLDEDAAPPSATAPPGPRQFVWPALAAAALAACSTVSWLHFREAPAAPAASLRFQITPPADASGTNPLLNMSPDGRKLAFLSGGKLWVHFLESGETRDLTAANGVPFWSPDSRWIGYALRGRANLTMLRIEATGGVPSTVAETTGWGGATWNQDGLIIVSDGNAISRLPAAGGTPVQLIQRDRGRRESLVYAPQFLPDGRHFIYTRRSADPKNNAQWGHDAGGLRFANAEHRPCKEVDRHHRGQRRPAGDAGVVDFAAVAAPGAA
jgi:hypothetical protein